MTPDLINALFELGGAFAIAFSIKMLYNDRLVRGVSWIHVSFFFLWGMWNLYFYPAVDAYLSFYAGILLATANGIYVIQLVYYTAKEKYGYRTQNIEESDHGWGV